MRAPIQGQDTELPGTLNDSGPGPSGRRGDQSEIIKFTHLYGWNLNWRLCFIDIKVVNCKLQFCCQRLLWGRMRRMVMESFNLVISIIIFGLCHRSAPVHCIRVLLYKGGRIECLAVASHRAASVNH